MNTKKSLLLAYAQVLGICSLISFTSCDNKVIAEFSIKNSTSDRIDSLSVEPNVSLPGKYVSVEANEIVNYKADMTGLPQVDGAYVLRYKLNQSPVQKVFGYYTNGQPLSDVFRIEIRPDTTIIREGNY